MPANWEVQFDEPISEPEPPQYVNAAELLAGGAQISKKPRPKYMKLGEIDVKTHKIGEIFGHNTDLIDPMVFTKTIEQLSQIGAELKSEYTFKDDKGLVGIEVEVENVRVIHPNTTLLFWSVHEDGSLRNSGREFKTPPIQLRYLPAAFDVLFTGINKDVDFSHRTSIHVHMDVRKMTMSQVHGLIYAYAAVENLLFKYASQDRRKNIFCVPITESYVLGNTSIDDKPSFLYNIENMWHKYTAMNLLTVKELGTVEFRQMPGTDNIKKLLIWCDLLSRLKIFAYRYSSEQILDMIQQLNTNSQYRKFVEDVFGNLTVYLDMSMLQQDMEKAVYVVKNSNLTNEFHHKVIHSPVEKNNFLKLFEHTNRFTRTQIKALSKIKLRYAASISFERLPGKRGPDIDEVYNFVASNYSSLLYVNDGLTPFVQHIMKPDEYPYPLPVKEDTAKEVPW